MKPIHFLISFVFFIHSLSSQNLSQGLIANDLTDYSMQDIDKPNYLQTIKDPTFGTTIRRITNAGEGNIIVPMYSTVQAWNSDETYMILYNVSENAHQLLNGITYNYIRDLSDIKPNDIENIFWDTNNPNYLFYVDKVTNDLIKYQVETKVKTILANLQTLSSCTENISLGNDVQMMSWDSDIIGFRCGNSHAYYYQISTEEMTEINVNDVNYYAPMPLPSGALFYHNSNMYDDEGNFKVRMNEAKIEHSCLGKMANGNDAHFAISFEQGPEGGCLGNIIAHDANTGECFPIISQDLGYRYPKSGTHISALAYKNENTGWLCASMIGYDEDGNSLLDQELIISKANKDSVEVYRIAHHRSDEKEFDYWGEPHATISPSGTRVLFGSDWSGSEDGKSIDSYVVELPAYSSILSTEKIIHEDHISIYPQPLVNQSTLTFDSKLDDIYDFKLFDVNGRLLWTKNNISDKYFTIEKNGLDSGIYFFEIMIKNTPIYRDKLSVK